MSEPRTAEDRQQERRDELESMLIREAVSIGAMVVVLLLMSPKAHMWMRTQLGRLRRQATARKVYEAKMLALLQFELSRDLPLVEHGLVDP